MVALGAYTNLALLAVTHPGILDGVPVVVIGGWIDPPAPGLPQWGPERDFNGATSVPHRYDMAALASAHAGLADDLLNFHHDPVAAAVALGWSGVSVEPMPLVTTTAHDVVRFHRAPAGRLTKVLDDVDADAFTDRWLHQPARHRRKIVHAVTPTSC